MSYRAQENLFQLGESFFKTQMYIDTFDEKRTHYFYDEKAFEMMGLMACTTGQHSCTCTPFPTNNPV